MAGPSNKKRLMGSKFQKPMKRQKRERRVQKEYHSSTEDEEEGEDQQQDFDAVNLLDSDDDIHTAKADDIGAEEDGSGLSSSEDDAPSKKAVLARSAAAHETSRAVLDSALEAKAKRALREQKRKAQEKGRVRDVLLAPVAVAAAPAGPGREEKPEITTGEILAAEAKLRKVAQRGVVKMFNAVRAAQVKSTEAERATRQAGVIGMARREEKVNEMSKKGFLDLLASGGSALNKSASAIEEA
ncbi:Ribosomal RNA-processing protein 15 [Beauveria bassiana]|nr:Ribosomal RNA-processing protein 15 [Beauveria bassiana]